MSFKYIGVTWMEGSGNVFMDKRKDLLNDGYEVEILDIKAEGRVILCEYEINKLIHETDKKKLITDDFKFFRKS